MKGMQQAHLPFLRWSREARRHVLRGHSPCTVLLYIHRRISCSYYTITFPIQTVFIVSASHSPLLPQSVSLSLSSFYLLFLSLSRCPSPSLYIALSGLQKPGRKVVFEVPKGFQAELEEAYQVRMQLQVSILLLAVAAVVELVCRVISFCWSAAV